MKNRRRSPRQSAITHAVQMLEPRQLMTISTVVPDSVVVMNTSLGEVAIQLDSDMPITTANFLSYVEAGSYNNTIFHRIAVDNQTQLNGQTETYSIVQGGGFTNNSGTFTPNTTTTGLTEGLSYGTLSLSSAMTTAIPAGTTLTLINSTDSTTQSVVLASNAGVGDTSLSVNAFTADDKFASGSSIDNGTTSIGVTLTGGTTAPIVNEATSVHTNSAGTIAMARTSSPNSATSQFFFNVTDNSQVFPDPTTTDGTLNPGYATFGNVIRGMGIVDTIDNLSPQTVGNFDNVPETNTGGFVTINTATVEDTLTVTIGKSGAAGDQAVSFRDPSTQTGTTISLTNGNATVTFTGTNLSAHSVNGTVIVTGTGLECQEISSTNTTASSVLTFSSPGRNKHVNIGEIDITGSMKSISGTGVNLTGDITVSGSINSIKLLASNAAGVIDIDTNQVPNAPATVINIPFLSDISIESGGNIQELITRQYTVNDGTSRGISASDITKVMDFGLLNASISAGIADSAGNPIGGDIHSVRATEITGNIEGATIESVTAEEMQDGTIFSSAAYKADTFGITKVNILGPVDADQFVAVGNIGSIKAASMSGTVVLAGYNSSGTAADGFQFPVGTTGILKSLNLKKAKGAKNTSFSDSQIVAPEIDSLHLGRVATSITSGASIPVMGIQTNDLKSLSATTDQKQSLDLSNVTSQTALNADIAKRGLKLNASATVGTVATGTTTTAGFTAGDSYSAITLSAALATALPIGSVVTIVSGSNTQTATLSAAAAVGATSLTVTPFIANAAYAAGSTVQGAQTTNTELTSGNTYSSITLNGALTTALPSGTAVTLVSSTSTTQTLTLSVAANVGDTSLTVTPFTANAEYDAGSTIDGTEVSTTTSGLTSGDSYTSLILSDSVTTAVPAGSTITITSGSSTQTATLAADANVGDTSLSVTSFAANAAYASGATITNNDDGSTIGTLSGGTTIPAIGAFASTVGTGTLGTSTASTAGLTSGVAYTSVALTAPVTAALAQGAVLTLVSGNNTQILTLGAAASVGDTSLTISFTANNNYPAGSIIKGVGFVFDILPASSS